MWCVSSDISFSRCENRDSEFRTLAEDFITKKLASQGHNVFSLNFYFTLSHADSWRWTSRNKLCVSMHEVPTRLSFILLSDLSSHVNFSSPTICPNEVFSVMAKSAHTSKIFCSCHIMKISLTCQNHSRYFFFWGHNQRWETLSIQPQFLRMTAACPSYPYRQRWKFMSMLDNPVMKR